MILACSKLTLLLRILLDVCVNISAAIFSASLTFLLFLDAHSIVVRSMSMSPVMMQRELHLALQKLRRKIPNVVSMAHSEKKTCKCSATYPFLSPFVESGPRLVNKGTFNTRPTGV